MLRGCKSQRPSGEGRLYFGKPNADGGDPGPAKWRREEGAGGKARSPGVGNVCSGIQADREHGGGISLQLFSQEVLGQLSIPSTGQELDHFNSTNQSRESGPDSCLSVCRVPIYRAVFPAVRMILTFIKPVPGVSPDTILSHAHPLFSSSSASCSTPTGLSSFWPYFILVSRVSNRDPTSSF